MIKNKLNNKSETVAGKYSFKNNFKKRSVGLIGERVAEVYFKSKGYRVIDKNYRKLRGEIDLIVIKDNIIHFVEVKTSSRHLSFERSEYSNAFDPAHSPTHNFNSFNRENLHKNKIGKVIRISEIYRAEKTIDDSLETEIDGLLVDLMWQDKLGNGGSKDGGSEGDVQIRSIKVQFIPCIDRMIRP